jgi:hypothetical protein
LLRFRVNGSHLFLPAANPYYEATHPKYSLTHLGDSEIVAIALHLALCPLCRDQFEVLCELSEAEEQGEEPEQEE